MPVYSIQAPDGKTYEIEGPAGASQEDVINAVLAQHPNAQYATPPKSIKDTPIDNIRVEDQRPEAPGTFLGATADQWKEGLGSGLANVIEGGINNTIGMVANPINATINELAGTNLETNLGGDLAERITGAGPDDSLSGAIQRGIAGGGGLAGLARAAASRVPGVVGTGLAELGATPLADMFSGGASELSSKIAENYGAGPVGQIMAGLVGGGLSYAGFRKAFDELGGQITVDPTTGEEAFMIPRADGTQEFLPDSSIREMAGEGPADGGLTGTVTDTSPTLSPADAAVARAAGDTPERGGALARISQEREAGGFEQQLQREADEFVARQQAAEPTAEDLFAPRQAEEAAMIDQSVNTTNEVPQPIADPETMPIPPQDLPPNVPAVPPVRTPTNRLEALANEAITPVVQKEVIEPANSVVERLTSALTQASKLNKEQQKLYTQERAERFREMRKRAQYTEGEAGLAAEMAALKGEMKKVDFEPVRSQFTQEEIDGLMQALKLNKEYRGMESLRARIGLTKLLGGAVPTASELDLLKKAFPPEMMKAVLSNKDSKTLAREIFGNTLNLPRALMSTIDMSAPFRQGVFMITRPQFWKSIVPMIRSFGEQKFFDEMMTSIRDHPNYDIMDRAGLAVKEYGTDYTSRDFIQSNYAEAIPVIKHGIKASNRAFETFLFKLRADTFNSILERNPQLRNSDADLTALANYVNTATGRGDLGRFEKVATELTAALFSPRLMASRIKLLNPLYYASLPPVVRVEAMRDLIGFGATAGTVLSLAALSGADIETDARSSDFLKIKVGDTRYDILGGFGQYAVLAMRLASNQTKTGAGEVQDLGGYGKDNGWDKVVDFISNKSSPVASYIIDFLRKENAVGEPFHIGWSALERVTPMFTQDLYEAYQKEGMAGALKTTPGFVGVGVQTYESKAPRFEDMEIPTEFESLGMPGPVKKTLPATKEREKIELTDEQHAEYQKLSDQWTVEMFNNMKEDDPDWDQYTEEYQKEVLKDIAKEARKMAREALFFGDNGENQ